MVGPPVGGFIVTYSTWRWIFFINVPICMLGIVLVTLFIKNIRETDVPPLDLSDFLPDRDWAWRRWSLASSRWAAANSRWRW